MNTPDGNWSKGNEYRYGFNGKEKDTDFLNNYDYGFRIYNPTIARYLSIDPLTNSYPFYSPYHFAGNKPIAAIDIDGLEEGLSIMQDLDAKELYQKKITAKEVQEKNTARGVGALIGGAIVLTGGGAAELTPVFIEGAYSALALHILWAYEHHLQLMWATEIAWGVATDEAYTGPTSTGGSSVGVRKVFTGTIKRFKLNELGFAIIEATKEQFAKAGTRKIAKVIFGQHTSELEEETFSFIAHSGYGTKLGLPDVKDSERLFAFIESRRKNGSEVKLFEYFARKLGATEKG